MRILQKAAGNKPFLQAGNPCKQAFVSGIKHHKNKPRPNDDKPGRGYLQKTVVLLLLFNHEK